MHRLYDSIHPRTFIHLIIILRSLTTYDLQSKSVLQITVIGCLIGFDCTSCYWSSKSSTIVVQPPSKARHKLRKENCLPMSTTKIAATLYQLQQLDLELDRLNAEQQALVNSLQGDSVLKKLRAETNIAQHKLKPGLQTP